MLLAETETQCARRERRVLVVDDEASMRSVLERFVTELGYPVKGAGSGRNALDIIEASEPLDIVLSDIKMPEMDGIELLREIRQRHPNLQVVLFTGYARLETALEAMRLGAFDFILKPFRLEQIDMVLNRAHERLCLLEQNEILTSRLAQTNQRLEASEQARQLLEADKLRLADELAARGWTDAGTLAALRAGPPPLVRDRALRTRVAGLASELERLTSLRERGVITDEEYRASKRRLIEGG